jgi:hypothetical protein
MVILLLLFVAVVVPNVLQLVRTWSDPDPSQLFIHYARYGYGNWWWQYRDVTKLVRLHIKDNSINLTVSNKYFGDPKFGRLKTLRVKYSYSGSTDIIELPEDKSDRPSRLVLPPMQLASRTAMDAPASLQFRDEWTKTQHLRAHELGLEVSELFTPLQIEAFGIAKDLRELAASKPRPVFDTRDYGAKEDGLFSAQEPGKLAAYMTAESTALQQWRQEVRAKYVLSKLEERATRLYHRFVDEAHIANHHLASLVGSADTSEELVEMAATIRKIAFEVEEVKP